MPHRFIPPPWVAVFVDAPLALVSMLAVLASPEMIKPLAGCFAGGFAVWWFLDGRPWHRRLGYCLVSAVLGAGFGWSLVHLLAVIWPAWPHQGDVGIYLIMTLISVYLARGVRGVAKAWTDDPAELAELIKDFLHRLAGRGVRRPPEPRDGPPAGG